jgi:hypothetical protein
MYVGITHRCTFGDQMLLAQRYVFGDRSAGGARAVVLHAYRPAGAENHSLISVELAVGVLDMVALAAGDTTVGHQVKTAHLAVREQGGSVRTDTIIGDAGTLRRSVGRARWISTISE